MKEHLAQMAAYSKARTVYSQRAVSVRDILTTYTQLMCALAIDGHDPIPPKDKAGNLPSAKRAEAATAEIEAEK
jgi:hypothetical protein